MQQNNIGALFLKDRPTLVIQDVDSYQLYKEDNHDPPPILEVNLPSGDLYKVSGAIQMELRRNLSGAYSDRGYHRLGRSWGGILEFDDEYSKGRGLATLKVALKKLERIVIEEE